MASRERINRVKIEGWRVSRVPIDPTETIFQGDLLVWSTGNKRAQKQANVSGWTEAATFVGMADHTNPVETAGSTRFLSDQQSSTMNVVQFGLVEVIIGEAVTIYPFDKLTMGADAQTVLKTGATANNQVGYVDPAYGAAGKAVTSGTVIRMWLKVVDDYRVF